MLFSLRDAVLHIPLWQEVLVRIWQGTVPWWWVNSCSNRLGQVVQAHLDR